MTNDMTKLAVGEKMVMKREKAKELQERIAELKKEYDRRRKEITLPEDIQGHAIYIEGTTRARLKELSRWYNYIENKILCEYGMADP